jgi:two-component system OmpR family response regulator
MRVLVIEDSERLRRSLQQGLSRSGFTVDVVGDGGDGLAYASHGRYDAIVLDLMLPVLDGLTVLRRLRAAGNNAHVLILSAKEQVHERVAGLEQGADDYLTKPFDFDELVARLRALIRRKYGDKSPVHRLGELCMDTGRRTLLKDGQSLPLTKNEYAVLEYLVARRGRVVSKTELVDHLYSGSDHGSANAVEVFIHQLRKKVHDAGHGDIIRTHRGHGYVIE